MPKIQNDIWHEITAAKILRLTVRIPGNNVLKSRELSLINMGLIDLQSQQKKNQKMAVDAIAYTPEPTRNAQLHDSTLLIITTATMDICQSSVNILKRRFKYRKDANTKQRF